jgi:hypothetical protein
MLVESRTPWGSGNVAPPDGQRQTPAGRRFEIRAWSFVRRGMGRVGGEASRIGGMAYGFLAAIRRGDLYAPPHVVTLKDLFDHLDA